METLLPTATTLGAALSARNETLAVAESSSGGLVAAALLSVPGASADFPGGAGGYTARARPALAGLDEAAITGRPWAPELSRAGGPRAPTHGTADPGASGTPGPAARAASATAMPPGIAV